MLTFHPKESTANRLAQLINYGVKGLKLWPNQLSVSLKLIHEEQVLPL